MGTERLSEAVDIAITFLKEEDDVLTFVDGDMIHIMNGKYKGKEGKILKWIEKNNMYAVLVVDSNKQTLLYPNEMEKIK